MRITLIGMSGSGKSLWSSVLSRHGFHKLGCDNAIGRRLVDDDELPYAVSRALTMASIRRRTGECLMLHAAGLDNRLIGEVVPAPGEPRVRIG